MAEMTREQRTRSRTDHTKVNKAQENYRRFRQAFRLREKRSQPGIIELLDRHFDSLKETL